MRLAAAQRLGGDVEGRQSRVERATRAPLLLLQPLRLVDDVLDLALQLALPEVDVVEPLLQPLGAQRLRPVRVVLRLLGDAVRLPPVQIEYAKLKYLLPKLLCYRSLINVRRHTLEREK